MFKTLGNQQEDPGFDGAVLLSSNSQYWLVIDDNGNQLPPFGVAAVDSEIASSARVAELLSNGSVALNGDFNKPKKKKKTETDTVIPETVKVATVPQAEPELKASKVESKIDTVANEQKLENNTIVAEPVEEKQVSSNKNIVNPN